MHIYHCHLDAEALLPGSPEAQQAVSTVARRMKALAWNSVPDPWHFGVDPRLWLMYPDPDPRIHATD